MAGSQALVLVDKTMIGSEFICPTYRIAWSTITRDYEFLMTLEMTFALPELIRGKTDDTTNVL
jgi:hypothetical protein